MNVKLSSLCSLSMRTLVYAAFIACVDYSQGQEADPLKPNSISDVVQIIEKQRSMHSLLVSYNSRLEIDPQLIRDGRVGGVMTETSATFAFSGDKRHVTSEGRGILNDGQPDEHALTTTIFDGEECRSRTPTTKSITIHRARSAYCEMNAYTSALKWPITEAELEHAVGDPATVHFLPYMLSAPGWEIDSDHEVYGQYTCAVVRNQRLGREVWLGGEVGYTPVKVIHRNPTPDNEAWITEYDDFAQFANGIWLPKLIRTTDVWKASTNSPAGRLQNTITVSELLVDAVPDDLFVLEPQPGELVINERTGVMYHFVPASDTTLHESVTAALHEQEKSQTSRTVVWLNIGLFIGIAVVWAIWNISRRMGRRR